MHEIVKNYLGKDCIIYMMTSPSQIVGIIREINGNWISVESVENGQNTSIVNLDYVLQIKEYPLNKKGKRKAFA